MVQVEAFNWISTLLAEKTSAEEPQTEMADNPFDSRPIFPVKMETWSTDQRNTKETRSVFPVSRVCRYL